MKCELTGYPPGFGGRRRGGGIAAWSRPAEGCRCQGSARGFSLIELLVAMAVISLMLLFLAEMTGSVADTWAQGESRVETFQSARASLELITREMTPAVVDTRMQFVVLPAEELERVGATNVVTGSQAALWMAPLGEQGNMRCVGYYLYRDDAKQFYRLKRIFIHSDYADKNDPRLKYFPAMVDRSNARNVKRVSATDAAWFTDRWDSTAFDEENPDNDNTVVSTVADGVLAMWIQPIDVLGNPIPWLSNAPNHPQSDLIYNSAAYMYFADPYPFDDGTTTTFMQDFDMAMKANRVPSAMDITVVTLDKRSLVRKPTIPIQENRMDSNGALDVVESVRAFNEALIQNNIKNARTFSTRVKLLNGS